MFSFLSFLRRLQWKMTFSYMLVTLGVLLVVEFLVLTLFFIDYRSRMSNDVLPKIIEDAVTRDILPIARPAFETRDIDALNAILQDTTSVNVGDSIYLNATLDIAGRLQAFTPSGEELASLNTPTLTLADSSSPPTAELIASRLPDIQSGTADPVFQMQDGWLVFLFPVQRPDGDLAGILTITHRHYSNRSMALVPVTRQIIQTIGGTLIPLSVIVGTIGMIFGYLTSRGLVQRLKRVSDVTAGWSQGDFSTFIDSQSGDELGQLARRLNQMAEKIQNLMHTRQQLAVAEERNHLARELHDSVKQQVFAAGAQLRAGRTLHTTEPDKAEVHFQHADELLMNVRHELTTIVQQLRPGDLDGQHLSQALQQLGNRWSLHTGIDLQMKLNDRVTLSPRVEKAFYRVTQEALSNIEKHSRATRVTLNLTTDTPHVTLTITDNGTGFDAQDTSDGFGLESMRQRIMRLPEGTFTVQSTPGNGTRLQARVLETKPNAMPPQ